MATGKGAALPPLVQAVAGAAGASFSNAIVFPLDLTTTRMQTQPIPKRSSKRAPGPYSTLVKAVSTILREEGVMAFYRGLAPDTLSTLISNLLFYFYYSVFRDIAVRRRRKAQGGDVAGLKEGAPPALGALRELLIGCLSGVLSKGVTMPLSNVTVRQQTAAAERKEEAKQEAKLENGHAGGGGGQANGTAAQDGNRRLSTSSIDSDSSDDSDVSYTPSTPSLFATIRLLIKERGVLGLWAGFPSACLLTLNPSITLYLFEALKRLLPRSHRANPSAGETFLTSAIASGIATTVLYPLILSKTLVQYRASQKKTQPPSLPSTPGAKRRRDNNSALGALKMAWRRQGVKGVTMGLESQLVKVMIGQGITLTLKKKVEEGVIMAYKRSLTA